jgi:hypothetical protein
MGWLGRLADSSILASKEAGYGMGWVAECASRQYNKGWVGRGACSRNQEAGLLVERDVLGICIGYMVDILYSTVVKNNKLYFIRKKYSKCRFGISSYDVK